MKKCPDCIGSGQGTRHMERVAGRNHVTYDRCETCDGSGIVDESATEINEALLDACKEALPLLYDTKNRPEAYAAVAAIVSAAIARAEGAPAPIARTKRRFVPSTDAQDLGAEQ